MKTIILSKERLKQFRLSFFSKILEFGLFNYFFTKLFFIAVYISNKLLKILNLDLRFVKFPMAKFIIKVRDNENFWEEVSNGW